MNRFTSLALAAVLTPALALGIGSVFAEDRDADTHKEQRSTGQPVMTSDEDRGGSSAQARDQQAGDMEKNPSAQEEAHITGKPEGGYSADELIGETVKNRQTDEDVGKVSDLVIDQDGKVVAVVISTGGMLGIGEKDVAVAWDRIERTVEDDDVSLYLDMDEDALKAAPEYEPN